MAGVLRRLTDAVVRVGLGGVAVGTLAAALARLHWTLELFSHFTVQYALGALVVAAMAGARRQWRVSAAAALLLTWQLVLMWPSGHALPASRDDPGEGLRVVSFNIHGGSDSHTRIPDFVAPLAPDIIALVEATPEAVAALDEPLAAWPHRVLRPEVSRFGLALYSRHPISEHYVGPIGELTRPSVVATVELPGGPLTFVAVHPPPPVGARLSSQRNRFLAALTAQRATFSDPLVICGDFNATSWSPQLSDVIDGTDLRYARTALGPEPTWPTHFLPLSIPIDHCLVSRDVAVIEHRVAEDIGSDHLPLVVDLLVRPAP